VTPITSGGKPDVNTVVPLLFDEMFNDWLSGVAFAAIAIGALVPAAIMSIAAANLFTRSVYREYLRPEATPEEEARISKLTSLVVKAGAVLVIIAIDPQFSIDLQLIGGVIVLQTLPAIVLGLYTAWFHRWALLAGWAAGLTTGLVMLYKTANPLTGKEHFGGAQYALSHFGSDTKVTIYTGILALAVNLAVTAASSLVLHAAHAPAGTDETQSRDYDVESDEVVRPLPVSPG
jgi:SSS family solute:Na+ symporter